MKQSILENLKLKFPQHTLALFSSFVYVLVAFALLEKDMLAFAFLFLVFLTSLFYHSHPENIFFRLGDWLASCSFIFYIVSMVYLNKFSFNIFAVLAFFAVIFWAISEIAYYNKFNKIFNISHTLWHVLSAFTVFMVIFSIY